MTTREHLDKQIAELAGRGVKVTENPELKIVIFEMPPQQLMTISDKKLYSLMQTAHKVELMFLEMGYTISDKEYTDLLKVNR